MNYNITRSDLDSLNTLDYYNAFCKSEPNSDIFGVSGQEHFKLLSFLSTKFNNSNILDIGTHAGQSSLALSYNSSNTVFSFDIVDQVKPYIKTASNIKFHLEDLFNKEVFDKWANFILACPFIFLDVDPHNGFMETTFLSYLKDINYPGFVVCDDIWFFKEMRNNFWYKIEDKYRYDMTDLGHWSGTGIVTFNPSITFNKYDVSNWTLVTAYFNLTKCPDASKEICEKDQDYYMSHSLSTLSLPHNMIIHCDVESLGKIRDLRPAWLEPKTRYVVRDFDDICLNASICFRDYRERIIQNRKEHPYYFDNRNTASYYLFCMARYVMLREAILQNPFGSTHFAWINFCIERMGFKNLIRLDEGLSVNRDKFSTCYIDYIPRTLVENTEEYFKWGRCSMCSGFFTGNKHYMYEVCGLIINKFLEYLGKGYGHADEQLYSPVYFENLDLFEHYYGDYHQMITNYKYIYDSPEPPIYNFITRSFNNKNFKKCLEACEFVFNSYCLDKCKINNDYLNKLYHYYMNCKKELLAPRKRMAYYTCFFGGKSNYSFMIPPLPSLKHDCYFFTNNREIQAQLCGTKWIAIFMNNIPIHNSHQEDSMETKLLKSCPHKFPELSMYEYLCWLDSKLEIKESKVDELVFQLSNDTNKVLVLSKHSFSDVFTSVWDEFKLAMSVTKYKQQEQQNVRYIETQIKSGFSEKIDIHFCSGWSIRKMCEKTNEIGDLWYEHIKMCGIECQISLSFIQQKYRENIISVDYQYPWKYSFE